MSACDISATPKLTSAYICKSTTAFSNCDNEASIAVNDTS